MILVKQNTQNWEGKCLLKGGCAHCDMFILDSKLIGLDPIKYILHLPLGYMVFSLLGQKQVCDTGYEAVMKMQKKSKLVYRK